MGGRIAVGLALVCWAGAITGAAHADWAGAALFAGVVLLVGSLSRRDGRGTAALVAACLCCAAARSGASAALLERRSAGLERLASNEPVTTWLRAAVVDHPWREGDAPSATVRTIGDSPLVPSGTRLHLWLPAGSVAEWGDTLDALVRLDVLFDQRVPGGFSARAAAHADGVAANGRALVARVCVARGLAAWPRATIVRWRRALELAYAQALSPAARELVTPLVTGDRSAVSPALGGDLQGAGLTHLLALSGLHIAWLASVARGIAAMAGAGLGGRAVAGALCALAYAGIAGPLPSLMRAVATELVVALARLTGRALDPVQALALSVFVLLAIAPGWAGDLGFQLSCAATLGLVTVGTRLGERIRPWRPAPLRALAGATVPTIAAQVVSLPLLLARFHALPWTTLLANLLAVPISGLLLASAWLGAVLEALAPGTGRLPLRACEVLAAAMRQVAARCAAAPLALLPCGHEPGIVWLASMGAGLLAWALAGPRALDDRRGVLPPARVAARWWGSGAIALALLLALTAPPLQPPPGRWWLIALDVGQGDAIALAFGGEWWLVDSGPRTDRSDAGRRSVLPFLRWAAVRRLDVMALTHDDSDHTGGATAIRAGIPVTRVIAPPPLPHVRGPSVRFGADTVTAGDQLRRSPPVRVLWPERGLDTRADNDAGLVLEVGEGDGRAWLTADVDSTVEAALAGRLDSLARPLAVLKVSHHGSGSSSGSAFLQRVRPRFALLSCGRHNVFGHPAPGALERLTDAGASIRRTDREGTLWLELSSRDVRVLAWRADSLGRRESSARPVAAPCPRW